MIIFDTETTGLHYGHNQICQLAYVKIDSVYNVKYAKNFYFMVNEMEPGAESIHGLSVEKLKELSCGKTFKDHAQEIYNDFLESELLIAHNISFDYNFLSAELSSAGYDVYPLGKIKDFCTMHAYTDIARVSWNEYYNSYKYPKLEELSRFLDLESNEIEDATRDIFDISDTEIDFHDARLDVIVAMQAFKAYEKFRKVREYKDILLNIKRAETRLNSLKEHVGADKFESVYDIDSDDIGHIQEVFDGFSSSDKLELTECIHNIVKSLAGVSKAEKSERERVAKQKEDELIDLIEKRIAMSPPIIKAIWSRHEDWGIVRESLVFGYQLAEDDYEEENVWLIQLDSNKYLLNRTCRIGNFSVVEVNSGQDKNVVNYHDKFEFEILTEIPCPSIVCLGSIDMSNTTEPRVIDNSRPEETPSIPVGFSSIDEDDIPF